MPITVLEVHGDDIRNRRDSAISLQQAAASEPANGVYLVARTWRGGHTLRLDTHFDRLERSASALGRELRLPRQRIRTLLASERHRKRWHDIRFRITAVLDARPWLLISIERAVDVPASLLHKGVLCFTAPHSARDAPQIKSTAWMHRRTGLAPSAGAAKAEAAYETLLVDGQGRILEGGSSNFFAVRDNALWTAADGVLEGVARGIVLTVAAPIIPVRMEAIAACDLATVNEAFISSATRGVIPIRCIDDVTLGPPGIVTRRISDAYRAWLDAHLEPLAG